MNQVLLLGIMPQGTEWLLILLVIVILFGASRLPQLAKAIGQSKRAFREGQDEAEKEAQLEKGKREKALQSKATADQSSLADVDDEKLFEEARRRAASSRAGESSDRERD
ncbi:MAG TPA: twin-arginine translocase TatA/TatE family subunit [Pyrinomonadaceae bacterium]